MKDEKEYLVVDNTDAYATSVCTYKGEKAMLKAIQHKEVDEIDVYEIAKRVRLIKRPAIIMDSD